MDPSAFWIQWADETISSGSDNGFPMMMMLLDSSSEEEVVETRQGGSQIGRRPNLERHRQFYDKLLHDDYCGPNPVYSADDFRRRFRIPIGLFDEIVEKIQHVDPYFVQKRDACKKLGLSARQKALAL